MGHLLKLILDVHLELEDLVRVLGVVDLLSHFLGFLVHASFEQALSVVKLVLNHVWVELGKLIVHISGVTIVLNVKVAVSQQGKSSSIPWAELQLIGQDANNLSS